MKSITVGKKVQFRTLSVSEMADIFMTFYDNDLGMVYYIIDTIQDHERQEARKEPPSIIEAIWNGLLYYTNILPVSDPDSPEIALANPATFVRKVSFEKKFWQPTRSTAIHPAGILIDPDEYLLRVYNPGHILTYDRSTSSQIVDNIYNLKGNHELFQGIFPEFKMITLGNRKLLYSGDISQDHLSDVYRKLYHLEYRQILLYIDEKVLGLALVPVTPPSLPARILDFSKITKILDIHSPEEVFSLVFTNPEWYDVYLAFISGKDTKIPPPSPSVVSYPVPPDVFIDFLYRRYFVWKYGWDKYKETGIIDIERKYGYDKKGNNMGHIYFRDYLNPEYITALEPYVKSFTIKPTKYPWDDLIRKLSRTKNARTVLEILSQLLIFIDNMDMEGFITSRDGLIIMCSHLYVYYNNINVSPADMEILLHPYKTQIKETIICRICGEYILSQDNMVIEYSELERDYINNVEHIELQNIKFIVTDITKQIMKGNRVMGFQNLVMDVSFVIYKELGSIISDLYKNKVLSLSDVVEQKNLYIAIYTYAVLLKLSNKYSKSGSLLIETEYTGKKIQDVFSRIILEITKSYKNTIQKYKNTFSEKTIKIIFLNAYKKLELRTYDEENIGETLNIPGPVQQVHDTFKVFPKVPESPATLEQLYEYLYVKSREHLVRYDSTPMSMENLFIGENINPFYVQILDSELNRYAELYFIEYIKRNPVPISGKTGFFLGMFRNIEEYFIAFYYGEDLHQHEFIGSVCKICGLSLSDIYKSLPDSGISILDHRNLVFRMKAFYKKYSIICPVPSEDEMREGKVSHIFNKKDVCVNCGYKKGEKDQKYYEKYGIISIHGVKPELRLHPPVTTPEELNKWTKNESIVYELATKMSKKLPEIGSQDIIGNWLHNIGYEIYATKDEMLTTRIETEYSRRSTLIDHIITVSYTVRMINSPENAPDYIKEFVGNASYDIHIDIPNINEYKQYNVPDEYFHDMLIKILLTLDQDVCAFILLRLFSDIQSEAMYPESELQKARSNIFEFYSNEYDELVELEKDMFRNVDYAGENDEYET